ncbi:unnamed protein product [Linum trigynum]|uniref:Uncharacterized protein n=1 Tax=Linum trigynum TaxID=586398 RepID=A0AAV2CYZ4_9ROSI
MAALLRHHPLPPAVPSLSRHRFLPPSHPPLVLSFRRRVAVVRASGNNDFDRFARKAWRSANDGFELFLFEAKKTVERIDRKYSVGRRLNVATQSAVDRARLIDRDLNITVRWRAFTMDFSRNWPRYRKQLNDLMDTPLGRFSYAMFFVWFALSGWLFRFIIYGSWILPLAVPLIIAAIGNNLVIKGSCPACRQDFMGIKNRAIRCAGCGNIVWYPEDDVFSRGGGAGGKKGTKPSKSDPNVIDVEFEEK